MQKREHHHRNWRLQFWHISGGRKRKSRTATGISIAGRLVAVRNKKAGPPLQTATGSPQPQCWHVSGGPEKKKRPPLLPVVAVYGAAVAVRNKTGPPLTVPEGILVGQWRSEIKKRDRHWYRCQHSSGGLKKKLGTATGISAPPRWQ